ncbi:MAG: hypothetical protein AAGI23_19940 [Bacteroidota bacterium]
MDLILELKARNEILFYFGFANLVAAVLFLILSFSNPLEAVGTNAWHKPIKFALSTLILSWSLAWYVGYLDASSDLNVANWIIVVTLGFEVVYIALQASRGELSHYNESTPFHAAMFSSMALAATIATLTIGYIGLKFYATSFPNLPDSYVWAIRLGIVLFVIFSFEGFVMGANSGHTVGAKDGGAGIPFLNWSVTHGDLRIAHFVGMHALQVLPLLALLVLRDLRLTIVAAVVYGLLAIFVFVQATRGRPFLQSFEREES